MRHEVCGSAGGGTADEVQAACRRGLNCRFGAGRAEERTQNMYLISVTLEVSKLSGWLNADASCRESKAGHAVGARYTGRHTGERRRATAVQAACRTGLDSRSGAGHGHGARACEGR